MDATYINTMDDMVDQLKSNTMSFGACLYLRALIGIMC